MQDDSLLEIRDHGGSLTRAAASYPDAEQPWLDLSTGINGRSYPLPDISPSAFQRLPEEEDIRGLAVSAARAYGAVSADHVVCAPGTQILLPMVAGLVNPGRACILSPTYAEHKRAAALCGHIVEEVGSLASLGGASLAVVVNPNNPDGAVHDRRALLNTAEALRERGRILVIDEAFMDVGPQTQRLDGDVEGMNIVVLRSFGKFFGLAGIRLGFAICDTAIAASLRARLGPWAVSGPTVAIGRAALDDLDWQDQMRQDLERRAGRLDRILADAGLTVTGGTTLYRYVRHSDAQNLMDTLGHRGILVRAFAFDPVALRFGIPVEDGDFLRLTASLAQWRARL